MHPHYVYDVLYLRFPFPVVNRDARSKRRSSCDKFGGKYWKSRSVFFPPPAPFLVATNRGCGLYFFHSEFDSITFRFASISTVDSARNNRIAEGNVHSGSQSIPGQDIIVHKSNKVGIESTDYSTSTPSKKSVYRNYNANTSDIQGQAGVITASQRTSKKAVDNQLEEVTVKTEEIDDGSTGESFLDILDIQKQLHRIRNLTGDGDMVASLFYYFFNISILHIACDHGASESALCEPSYDPHLSHSASTSSTTSEQFTSQVRSSDNTEVCAFEGRLKGDLADSLSNQDSENLPMNNVFSELQCEEELKYEEVAQNSTAHGPAAIPFVLNNTKKRKYPSWDERFKELVDFKAINDHTNVPRGSGPLGNWVHNQRRQYCLLKEGKRSTFTNDRLEKLESIGFEFKCKPAYSHWDQRFQELVDFKKINGHTNVPRSCRPLGTWVNIQRSQYHLRKEGNERREKLESIGVVFKIHSPWDQRFQELVDFKKVNGHTNVPQSFKPLGPWVNTQRKQYRLLKKGKHSLLISERQEKLESIGFSFNIFIK
eukprot:scaffold60253_cov29-Attheya_sp.AAC.1